MRIQAPKYLHLLPIIGIALIFAAFFYYDGYRFLSLASLKNHQQLLQQWVSIHYSISALSFMAILLIATTCAVPWSNIFTISAGFLFGVSAGSLYSIIGASCGAILLFLAVRYALDDWITKKAGHKIKHLQHEFQAHSSVYLLILRLIPIVPFSLVNIVAALAEVNLSTFVITTVIGTIPETLLYTLLGHDLSRLSGNEPGIGLLSPAFLLPVIGLCFLMILAILYQQYKRKKTIITIQPI